MKPEDRPEAVLLASLLEHLDVETYRLHGEPWADAWGASQWVAQNMPDGSVRYMQISVARND